MKKFKIGSGEVTNFLMLEKIARTGKHILLSSGMSSFAELDKSIDFINQFGNPLSLFQCTTAYPTSAEQIGLNVIPEMMERYDLPVGLSDHSGTIYPSLAAVSLGATLLEAHIVFDKRIFGPDAKASLEIDQFRQMVEGVRFISTSLNHKIDKNTNEAFSGLKKMFEKSLAVNKDLPAGSIIGRDDLEAKKPSGHGIPASQFETVLGKKAKHDLKRYQFLNETDLV